MNMDDNVDFNNINIGRSLNMAKRKDSPPSRKIIIAQNRIGSGINNNKNDIKLKTMTNIKSSTNDHLNKIYNITKEKKLNDENNNNNNNRQPKPIKYNLGHNELLSTNRKRINQLNPDSNREMSNERSLSKTKSSFKNMGSLVSPRTAASKLVRATDSISNLDMQNNSTNHQSSNSLKLTLSKDLSKDKINILKPKEESGPVKLFKKNLISSKQDEKFQILSDQLIDRVNMGRKKPQTLSSDRHFGSTKTTFTTQSAKNLQATAVVKKDSNNLIRTNTEINFKIKTSKLPELALLSSRDTKVNLRSTDIKNKNLMSKDKN
jgi:hypothetical protein